MMIPIYISQLMGKKKQKKLAGLMQVESNITHLAL
jgi:hypothetical protein